MMDWRLLSFWDSLFSGAMLNFQGVYSLIKWIILPLSVIVFPMIFLPLRKIEHDEFLPGKSVNLSLGFCWGWNIWAMKKRAHGCSYMGIIINHDIRIPNKLWTLKYPCPFEKGRVDKLHGFVQNSGAYPKRTYRFGLPPHPVAVTNEGL